MKLDVVQGTPTENSAVKRNSNVTTICALITMIFAMVGMIAGTEAMRKKNFVGPSPATTFTSSNVTILNASRGTTFATAKIIVATDRTRTT